MFYKSEFKFSTTSFVLVFFLWLAVTELNLVNPIFIPSPISVLQAFFRLLFEQSLLFDIYVTLFRVFAGFAVAFVLSIVSALIIFFSPAAKKVAEPFIAVLRYIPSPAILPLLILWFGIGELEKIVIVFLAIYPFMTIMLIDSFKSIPKKFFEKALVSKMGIKKIISRILLPFSLPQIIDCSRVCIAGGWVAIALAEIVGANAGIGHLIVEAKRFIHTPDIFVGILLFALFGLLTDFAFKLLYKQVKWVEQ